MSFDPIELLKKEINWWEESLKTQPIDDEVYRKLTSPKDSFFCSVYNNEHLLDSDCYNCPIYEMTNLQYCEETPYIDIIAIYDELLATKDEFMEVDNNKKQITILTTQIKTINDLLFKRCLDYLEFLKEVQIDMNK